MMVETGPKASVSCTRWAAVRVGAMEQHRRDKGAFFGVRTINVEVIRVAKDALGFLADDRRFLKNVPLLST